MDKKILIGLIDALINESISKIPSPEVIHGPRGFSGRDGRDFDFEDHKDAITEIIKANLPAVEELIGPRGSDGRDGRDFDYEENKAEIQNTIIECVEKFKDQLKLHFSDLSEEDIESLRGPQGLQGREGKPGANGRDFEFEEHREEIRNELRNFVTSIQESLRLKFSDLTDEEQFSLKGEKGDRGRDGRDFNFEDHKEDIKSLLPTAEELKFKFSDFTKEEIDSLKLKFSDLTEEDIAQFPRGARGQRGERGARGEQGEQGLPGKDGLNGRDGFHGRDGQDGKEGKQGPMGVMGPRGLKGEDAPYVTDVRIESDKAKFNLAFYFSDGEVHRTNTMEIPVQTKVVYQIVENYSGGSGGSSSSDMNIDGGVASSVYGGMPSIDGGGAV